MIVLKVLHESIYVETRSCEMCKVFLKNKTQFDYTNIYTNNSY